MIYLQINETKVIKGVRVICEELNQPLYLRCRICALNDHHRCDVACNVDEREDGKRVIFKKI